jgi:hypothetical protein
MLRFKLEDCRLRHVSENRLLARFGRCESEDCAWTRGYSGHKPVVVHPRASGAWPHFRTVCREISYSDQLVARVACCGS